MKITKRKTSVVFLILGMTFLVIGLATDNTAFSWVAIAFIVISLAIDGKWMRPRKR
jgi:hypothetical protein